VNWLLYWQNLKVGFLIIFLSCDCSAKLIESILLHNLIGVQISLNNHLTLAVPYLQEMSSSLVICHPQLLILDLQEYSLILASLVT
jgi:hypothetical protein